MNSQVEPGSILAQKYRVVRVLGAGGMGIIVEAVHIHLDQRVAIKFLLPEALRTDEAVMRFTREARAAVKIQSEHVARVLDVGELENGAPYMVMEYLEGHDLGREIAINGTIPIDFSIDYLLQAIEAIAEAHVNGIVHRDLKPANLFLTQRVDGTPIVKVLDFGISKVMLRSGAMSEASITKTATLMGSPLYMSPEQLRSTRNVDTRTDIWSLGVILHELICGSPAFVGETIPQLCTSIISDAPIALRSVWPDAPEGLEVILQTCMKRELSERYQNVGDLALALAEFAPERSRISIDRIIKITSQAGLPVSSSSGQVSRPPTSSAALSNVPVSPRHRTGVEYRPMMTSDQRHGYAATLSAFSSSGSNKARRRWGWAVGSVSVIAVVIVGIGAVVRSNRHLPIDSTSELSNGASSIVHPIVSVPVPTENSGTVAPAMDASSEQVKVIAPATAASTAPPAHRHSHHDHESSSKKDNSGSGNDQGDSVESDTDFGDRK